MSVSMCVCRRGSAGVLKIKKASHQRNELCFDSPLHIFARGGCHERMYKSGSRLYGLRRRRRIVQSGTSCADMPADAYHPARLPVTTLPIV